MSYNLNRPSGIGVIWSLGASTACYVGYFILAAHYKDIAANVFLIVAGSLLLLGALLMLVNGAASKNDKEKTKNNFVLCVLIFNIISLVVMYILAQDIRFD